MFPLGVSSKGGGGRGQEEGCSSNLQSLFIPRRVKEDKGAKLWAAHARN